MAINGLTINTYTPGLVKGIELEQISREIFAAAPKSEVKSSEIIGGIDFSKIRKADQGIELLGADVQLARQIAANQSGLNVNISQKAVNAIENLKAQAATVQLKSVASSAENGKIYIPNPTSDVMGLKEVFAAGNALQTLKSGTLEKDRKGSNPFSFYAKTIRDEKTEEVDSINIFA